MFWARIQPLFVPAIPGPTASLHRYWYLPVLTAVIVATAYLYLIVTIDNTNLGTTNGLWKSPAVFSWGHGIFVPLDSGGFLYGPVYGFLTRLIPDSLLRYGTPISDVTFRKMAVLNALFGGLASGLVFVLALRFTASPFAAGIVALVHAGAGFVLLNSINSEDIVPAYALFLAATVCFFEYLYRGGILLCAASAFLLALATLFHWTVMPPGLAAFGAVYAVLLTRRAGFFWAGMAWLFLFLVFDQTMILLAFPSYHIPVWVVLHPAKADAAGWVGFFGEKGWNLLVGMGNYFAGGSNLGDYKYAFANAPIFHLMLISWTALVLALIASIVTLVRKPVASGLPLLAAFGIVLFLTGEAGAVYSQPQDPQMQIEPMFAVISGMILLLGWSSRLAGHLWRQGLAGALALAGAANGAWNVHLMEAGRGQDSKALAAVAEMDRLFPKNTTLIVWHGFEGWTTWQWVLLWKDDSVGFFKQNVHLARPFTMNRGITGQQAAAITTAQIDAALASGERVVAIALWPRPAEEFVGSFTTVTTEAEARTYISLLEEHYRTGARWDTKMGPFVELLPAEGRAGVGQP
jgi:hypothetical protein